MKIESLNHKLEIFETDDYGVEVHFFCTNIADLFDDYLAEYIYVFTDISFKENKVIFYFGKASCIEKVKVILEGFATHTSYASCNQP